MRPNDAPSMRNMTLYKTRLFDRLSIQNAALATELRNTKLPWYHMRNAVDDDSTAEVFIYDEIGGSFGIDAAEFVHDLSEIDANNIDVRINSPGGNVFDSISIYNALVRHPANVTTYVDALAASAASIIAMAGDEVVMMVGSQLMIHDALAPEMGKPRDHREMAHWLYRQSYNPAFIYAVKGGGETAEWRERMLDETWMFADEAIDLRLADRVYTRPPKPKQDEPLEEPPPGEDEPVDEPDDDEVLQALMNRAHRLTNRGFKHLGRTKAPAPVRSSFDQMRESFLASLSK